MRLKRTYSSREVAALTGLTARQLQLWDAGGLLSPAIASHKTAAGGYTEQQQQRRDDKRAAAAGADLRLPLFKRLSSEEREKVMEVANPEEKAIFGAVPAVKHRNAVQIVK